MTAPTGAPLLASSLFFTPLPPGHAPAPGKEGHGRYMLTVPWNRVSGWGQPRIGQRQDLSFDPLAGVLQYESVEVEGAALHRRFAESLLDALTRHGASPGVEQGQALIASASTCFEGMKAYKTEAGDVRLFRPTKNLDRLKRSAARLGLPCDWDNAELLGLLGKLIALEAPLVPAYDGGNLYIRPTLLETSESFGIKDDAYAAEALLYIVTSVNLGQGLYKSADEDGIKLDACKNYIRAWPGGTGSYKLGANYVSVAKKPGFAMSLWLHGAEDYISEAGAANCWIIKEAADGATEFITMSLDNGIVLPGITRESIIQLLSDHASGAAEFPLPGMPRNVRVVERDIPMREIIDGLQDGTLKGMFGCGTGVVVVQIGEIQYDGSRYAIPPSPLIRLLRDAMTALQRGKVEHAWSWKVPAWEGVVVDETERVSAA